LESNINQNKIQIQSWSKYRHKVNILEELLGFDKKTQKMSKRQQRIHNRWCRRPNFGKEGAALL
jgi:hypothetical protein